MRANEFLSEWREAYLYHATSIASAAGIWHSDSLKGSTGPQFGKNKFRGVSTTRSYHYALGYLRNFGHEGGVIFWLNQDLIKRDLGRRRLKGYDWFADNQPGDVSDEFEYRNEHLDTDRFETVITQGGLTPFRKYVAKIEVWLPRTHDTLPLSPGERPADRALKSTDNPDKWNTNIRVDQNLLNQMLGDPTRKQAWDAMLRDPRTDVKSDLGAPRSYQGVNIWPKKQYDTSHPMYSGNS